MTVQTDNAILGHILRRWLTDESEAAIDAEWALQDLSGPYDPRLALSGSILLTAHEAATIERILDQTETEQGEQH